MFKFTGTWSSDRYHNKRVHGTVEIDLPYFYTKHFETTLILTYTGPFRKGETHSYNLQGKLGDDEKHCARYMLMPAELEMAQQFSLTLCERSFGWTGYYSCIYPYDIGVMNLKCTVTCKGCLEMQANQLGHMDPGGCLYDGCENVDDIL